MWAAACSYGFASRISIEAAAARRLANDLNVAESREWTECHLLGSWCTRDTALWFVGFVPSLVAIGLRPHARSPHV